MSTLQRDISYYLETARELADWIEANTDRIDKERQLPPEIVDAMATKGFFRLLVPRSLGGVELDHPDFLMRSACDCGLPVRTVSGARAKWSTSRTRLGVGFHVCA